MTNQTKTAIVTGASKGIGAAIALRLAKDGFAVVVNYAHDQAGAEQVVQTITSQGARAVAVRADMSEPSGIATLFDAAEGVFSPASVLVNNAGQMRLAPIDEATDADFETQCALNIGGVFRGMREAALRLQRGGSVISLSSSVVGLYQPGYGIYAATKAAVEAMTHVLAKELGAKEITVNAIAPGPVATELFLSGKPEALIERIKTANPMGRLGTPEDIAGAVAFLAGPDGRWINGQILRANGGVV